MKKSRAIERSICGYRRAIDDLIDAYQRPRRETPITPLRQCLSRYQRGV